MALWTRQIGPIWIVWPKSGVCSVFILQRGPSRVKLNEIYWNSNQFGSKSRSETIFFYRNTKPLISVIYFFAVEENPWKHLWRWIDTPNNKITCELCFVTVCVREKRERRRSRWNNLDAFFCFFRFSFFLLLNANKVLCVYENARHTAVA